MLERFPHLLKYFKIGKLPDINSPRHLATFGQQVQEEAEQVVFKSLMTLASNPEGNKDLVLTLRYFFDTQKSKRKRLSLYVVLASETDSLYKEAYFTAISLWSAQLKTCLDFTDMENPPEEIITFWDNKPEICHLVKREFFEELKELKNNEKNLEPMAIYFPWPYIDEKNVITSDSLYWDRLLDSLSNNLGCYCIDLVFRPIKLAPSDLLFWGLNKQIDELQERRTSSGSVADMAKKIYQDYWELCQKGNLFEFGLSVAGTDSTTVKWLAGSLGTALTKGGQFNIRAFDIDTHQWQTAQERGKNYRFIDGFITPFSQELCKVDQVLEERINKFSGTFWSVHLSEHEWGSMKDVEIMSGLAHLNHIVGPDTAREFLRLPIPRQGYPRTIELDTEKGAIKGETINVGKDSERGGRASIPKNDLTKHLFIAGATGSGKTTTLYYLLTQLWDKNPEKRIPFLVIEPAKKQYRTLKCLDNHPLKEDLIVFTVGQSHVTPLRFNPLSFSSVTLNEHLSMLETCFRGSIPLFGPLPTLLWSILEEAYKKNKWKSYDLGSDNKNKNYPLLIEIAKDWGRNWAELMNKIGYGDEIEANIKGALSARMMEWERDYLRDLFSPPKSRKKVNVDLPWEELLNRPVVIELDALNQFQANLVSLFILSQIREHLKKKGQTEDLRHIIVIEEAHNLFGKISGQSSGEDFADPSAAATKFLVQMLAEVRALGQGLIIVDQTPAAVAPEVLKNSNLKIAQRTTDTDDRKALAGNMLLNEIQVIELARLGAGEGYFYQPDLYRPVHINVDFQAQDKSQLINLSNKSLTDEELHCMQLSDTKKRVKKFVTEESHKSIQSGLVLEYYLHSVYRSIYRDLELSNKVDDINESLDCFKLLLSH